VVAELVVAAVEIWLATKVTTAVTTLSAATIVATTTTGVSFAVVFSHRHQHHCRQRCCHFCRLLYLIVVVPLLSQPCPLPLPR
jgi:hypothetical protein